MNPRDLKFRPTRITAPLFSIATTSPRLTSSGPISTISTPPIEPLLSPPRAPTLPSRGHNLTDDNLSAPHPKGHACTIFVHFMTIIS